MPRFLKQQSLHLLVSGYRSDTKHMKKREIKRQTDRKQEETPQIMLHLVIHLS